VTTQYLYDGNDIVQEGSGGAVGATYLRSLKIDEALIRHSSQDEFYHADALGSTLALTNAGGSPVTTYSYEPFGTTIVTGPSLNSFQYTGRENDGTGIYHYRARYYSPMLQRFVAEDPNELGAGDPNFYGYALNNPLRYTDPTGEIVPLLLICLRGAGTSLLQDALIGRKLDLGDAAVACVTGGLSKFRAVKKFADQKKGGRRGRGHEGHTAGESKKVDDAARQAGVPDDKRGELQRRIEDFKRDEGRGGDDNLAYKELRRIANELAQELRQNQSAGGQGQ
jgi:RHS repeat-associated protein